MKTLSLRGRLTLWYTLTLLVVLCLFGGELWIVQGRLGVRRVDRDLDALAATVVNVIQSELNEDGTPLSAAEEARETVTSAGRAVAVLDARGTTLAASWQGIDREDLAADATPRFRTVQSAGGAWRTRTERRVFKRVPLVLVVASQLGDLERERRELAESILIGIPIALLLAAAGGLWLASVGLRPLADMAGQAASIPIASDEDLGQSERSDELGQLARAFNGLIARLRGALRTQRQFMADASHELRTPASVILTATDVSLARPHRAEPDYRETLGIIRREAQRLGRLIGDMLMLARAEAGGYPLRPVDLYLDELIAEAQRAAQVLGNERDVTIRSTVLPEIPFRGDEDLLRRLVMNVVQNAVQHAGAGGTVSIDVRAEEGNLRIRVSDTGPGIRPEDAARIFDRFVQLDPARHAVGTGLGLPIARWIAEAHQGALTLESTGPAGSTFCISLPVGAARAERVPA